MIELHPDRLLTVAEAESILAAWTARPTRCSAITPLTGGMVNSVFRLEFDREPWRAVVKIHGSGNDTFAAEARGLEYLRAETECPVPGVYAHDSTTQLVPHAFLLLEDVSGTCLEGAELTTSERAAVEVQLASILGELHDHQGTGWGTVWAAAPGPGWAEVFAARLGQAWDHPELPHRLPGEVMAQADASIDLARHALADAGRPTLVHGDVWDGNTIVAREEDGWRVAALLDPDLQFADVELELAYLEVFGGDRQTFFDAYTRLHPLRPGYEERRLFYWLHTALVHVALFGDEFFCDYTTGVLDQIDRLWRR